MKRNIFLIFLFLTVLIFQSKTSAAVKLIQSSNIQLASRLSMSFPFGDFNDRYNAPIGLTVSAREFFQLRLNKEHRFYPGLDFSWFFMGHSLEENRRVQLFPLYAVLFWDTKFLHFPKNFLNITPYFGPGLAFINYKSVRTGKTAADLSYKIGFIGSFYPVVLKPVVLELTVEHFFVYENSASMPALSFALGVKYNFFIPKNIIKKTDSKRNPFPFRNKN